MIVVAIYTINRVCFWYVAMKPKEFYSFEPGCTGPGLAPGGLRIVCLSIEIVLELVSHAIFYNHFY